jgi:hypothetical protein
MYLAYWSAYSSDISWECSPNRRDFQEKGWMTVDAQVKGADGKPLSSYFPIFDFDLRSILPIGWQKDVIDSAVRYGRFSCLDGGSVTSRQREFTSTANDLVGVSAGTTIPFKIPWLARLYERDILDLANNIGMGRYTIARDTQSAININILPPGSQYEWHVDSNPLTGLLFVTDHRVGRGGEIVFRPDPLVRPTENWELIIPARAGNLLLFDAREAAHTVLPVSEPIQRISVPMNYYFSDSSCHRPEDLDHYLYSSTTSTV